MTSLRDVGMSYHGRPPTETNGYEIMQNYESMDPRVSFMSVFPVSAWKSPRDITGEGQLATSIFGACEIYKRNTWSGVTSRKPEDASRHTYGRSMIAGLSSCYCLRAAFCCSALCCRPYCWGFTVVVIFFWLGVLLDSCAARRPSLSR